MTDNGFCFILLCLSVALMVLTWHVLLENVRHGNTFDGSLNAVCLVGQAVVAALQVFFLLS